jgi:plastocyanin
MRLIHNSWALLLLLCTGLISAEDVTVTARVALRNTEGSRSHDAGNVVVWLMPVDAPGPSFGDSMRARLAQHNKSFEPHIVVVPVGSIVEFPNRDPFFHNVFSLFEGKRFDLGLYEAGTTRDVHFDKPGISYIFCNIHPEMSAVVVAVETPYYGVSDHRGQIVIPNVPAGRYVLHVWYEAALPETLSSLVHEVTISENTSTLGLLRLSEAALPQSHKNLYGLEYDPPAPDNPVYEHP